MFLRDNRLCMGLALSPYVLSKLADFLVRCAVREGATEIVNYLDNFCVVAHDFETGCKAQAMLLLILWRLGFHISFLKVTSPDTRTRLLGIDINTVMLEMSLPEDKLVAHCMKVVLGGHTYCRRIYDMVNAVAKPHYKVHLSCGFHKDGRWWLTFARRFNDKAKIIGHHTPYVFTYSDCRVGVFAPRMNKAIRAQVGHHHCPPDEICAGENRNLLEMWAAFMLLLGRSLAALWP